jgi:hypothetical protein
MNQKEDIKDMKKALVNLTRDTDALNVLENGLSLRTFFDVLKVVDVEIRHSNALAWFLDPSNSGKLGEQLLEKIIVYAYDYGKNLKNIAKMLAVDFRNVKVSREKSHTDILVECIDKNNRGFVIVIENKVKSRQSKNQLKRYREKISSEKKYKGVEKIYLFLRVSGEIANDDDWIEIDYNTIGHYIETIIENNTLASDVDYFARQYVITLKKAGMMDDEKMLQLATSIYNRHKNALDYISDNVQTESMARFECFKKWVDKEIGKKYNRSTASALLFGTEELFRKIFKDVSIDDDDKLKYCYYEIQKRSMNTIKLVFCANNVKPDIYERLGKIGKKISGKMARNNWKCWGVLTEKIDGLEQCFNELSGEELDTEVYKKIERAFKKIESKVMGKTKK